MYKKFLKRIVDLLFSLIALPFVGLILLLLIPLIKFTDHGPAFYNAQRRGRNGKPFTMYKLRSMKVNVPDLRNKDSSTFNSENDPRVTPIGRILRKTSLDEIPQLINVFKGDMSLVGPRPILASKPYGELNELSKARLAVRPGITGYAQAFYRNSITQEEKFEYDVYYIKNISFGMDIKILFITLISVLGQKNIHISTGKLPNTTVEEKDIALGIYK